jgi:hypothetical protein
MKPLKNFPAGSFEEGVAEKRGPKVVLLRLYNARKRLAVLKNKNSIRVPYHRRFFNALLPT